MFNKLIKLLIFPMLLVFFISYDDSWNNFKVKDIIIDKLNTKKYNTYNVNDDYINAYSNNKSIFINKNTGDVKHFFKLVDDKVKFKKIINNLSTNFIDDEKINDYIFKINESGLLIINHLDKKVNLSCNYLKTVMDVNCKINNKLEIKKENKKIVRVGIVNQLKNYDKIQQVLNKVNGSITFFDQEYNIKKYSSVLHELNIHDSNIGIDSSLNKNNYRNSKEFMSSNYIYNELTYNNIHYVKFNHDIYKLLDDFRIQKINYTDNKNTKIDNLMSGEVILIDSDNLDEILTFIDKLVSQDFQIVSLNKLN